MTAAPATAAPPRTARRVDGLSENTFIVFSLEWFLKSNGIVVVVGRQFVAVAIMHQPTNCAFMPCAHPKMRIAGVFEGRFRLKVNTFRPRRIALDQDLNERGLEPTRAVQPQPATSHRGLR